MKKLQKKKSIQPKLTQKQLKLKQRKKLIKALKDKQTKIRAIRAKAQLKYQIRCRKPVEDEIFDVDEYVKYLTERFKINGKTGQVGSGRPVAIEKAANTVHVASKVPFPKFYLKYLTKRYLKKNGLRDYVRVIADKKASYELRYFNIQDEKSGNK